MHTYLVTFANVFDHVIFKENPKEYFGIALHGNVSIKHFNSKFCEVKVKHTGYFNYHGLKILFPGIKIVRKQQFHKHAKYIEL